MQRPDHWPASIDYSLHPDHSAHFVRLARPLDRYHAFSEVIGQFNRAADQDRNKRNAVAIFVMLTIKEHPNYIEELAKVYPNYYDRTKKTLLYALHEVQGNVAFAKLNSNREEIAATKKESAEKSGVSLAYLSNIDLKSITTSASDVAKNIADVSYLWSAFFAAGDEQYLIKILRFLSSEDPVIKKAAFEMLNRHLISKAMPANAHEQKEPDYKDITDDLLAQDSTREKHLNDRLMFYYSVLWSLESYKIQSDDIEQKVTKIIKNHPELDYIKGDRLQ